MNSIDNLSNIANQETQVILEDGSIVQLNLIYLPAAERWTINVSRDDFAVNGIMISDHPNFMREWRRIIPFGLSCTTIDGTDPVFIDDFSTGRAVLYILTAADVALIEQTYLGAGVS